MMAKKTYYTLRYQGKRVKIPYPRPIRKGVCAACGRSKKKREIKITALHHTKYKYKLSQVLKNAFLALENAIEVCFGCHQIADGFRGILTVGSSDKLRNEHSMLSVAKLLPPEQQDRLGQFCRLFLEWRESG